VQSTFALKEAELNRSRIDKSWLTSALDGFSFEVDRLTPLEWDSTVANFEDLNLFQTAAFADGLRGEERMTHLLLRRHGVPIAGARLTIMKLPGFPIGVAYVKYGPFWRRTGSPLDETVYKAVIAALISEYAGNRGHMISISPRAHPHFKLVEEKLLGDFGFVARPALKRPITFFLVNTGLESKALKANLSQAWRHKLKRAELNQLDIRFHDPVEALPDFLALHEAMILRKKFIDREPLHVLPAIFRQLPASCSHIVTASYQGEVVAGAVVIVAGDIGYYLYGASADAALPLHAGYALQWRIACWLAEQGVCWYDLGDGFGALRQFKKGLVGKSGVMLSATEFDYWMSPQARLIGGALYRARNLVLTARSAQRWLHKKAVALRSERSSPDGQ
jgi:hypothetical protein